MTITKRLFTLGGGGALATALLLGGTHAWSYAAYLGRDYAITTNQDRIARVCDNTRNDANVKVEYFRLSGTRGNRWNYSDAGCSETGAGTVVTQMRVCEQSPGDERCGGWAYRP
ncbi:hypothetical protein [Sinosporangium siamense]|uniref:Uncharacterized protein n=1 Tax=Sinosporangium siamense TaxID=1367973 RepID=A0A919V6S7_9ACTN|nr:hypothetical protein [Sinosporangium siamense]GII92778.1 hypothetical protein Ssi02_30090 [Sinosporangium siamense]